MNQEILQSNESEPALFKEAQQLAEKARDRLKERYGLEQLSNIEFVGLRRIATEVLNELKTNPASFESLSDFEPRPETVVRFLKEFYGVVPDDFFIGMDHLQRASKEWGIEYDKRNEEMREYLRREQEKAHKP